MKYLHLYGTTLGPVSLAESGGCISHLHFGDDLRVEGAILQESPLLHAAAQELDAYLAGCLRHFTVPFKAAGTAFQHSVWQALCDIPYGATCSYGAVAAAIGNAKASRAVGGANNRNPIAIIIPCHRVIGANGAMVGYGGGLNIKERLLALEARYTEQA